VNVVCFCRDRFNMGTPVANLAGQSLVMSVLRDFSLKHGISRWCNPRGADSVFRCTIATLPYTI